LKIAPEDKKLSCGTKERYLSEFNAALHKNNIGEA